MFDREVRERSSAGTQPRRGGRSWRNNFHGLRPYARSGTRVTSTAGGLPQRHARSAAIQTATPRAIFSPTTAPRGLWWKEPWRAGICASTKRVTPARSRARISITFRFRSRRRRGARAKPLQHLLHTVPWTLGRRQGAVVLRGFRQPPSYFSEKLINQPLGHYFDVMTNGFGSMPSYASRVAPDDRWRIIAYIRALQLSESAKSPMCRRISARIYAGGTSAARLRSQGDAGFRPAQGAWKHLAIHSRPQMDRVQRNALVLWGSRAGHQLNRPFFRTPPIGSPISFGFVLCAGLALGCLGVFFSAQRSGRQLGRRDPAFHRIWRPNSAARSRCLPFQSSSH